MRAGTVCVVGEGVRVVPASTEDSTEQAAGEDGELGENVSAKTKDSQKKRAAALRMFGAFVPPELKAAQGDAIVLVDDIVPRIVGVDIEMKELEIKIRRARKYRAKEEGRSERAREVGLVEAL